MNKLIYCITTVNKDIFSGIKAFFVGIPNIFTMKFYERHSTGLIALAAIIGMIGGCIGILILGIHVAYTYFPDSSAAHMWIPVGMLWVFFVIGLYIGALFGKCKGL